MAQVLDELLGERISGGAVVVKHGQAVPLRHIEVLEAAHPVPDEGSLRGGLRLLEIAAEAGPDDLLIALITGGSSALAVVPAEGITLADKAETNRVLLASGADIVAINDVRKHISRIKGGRLARRRRLRDRQLHGVRRGRRPAGLLLRPHRPRPLHLRRRPGRLRPLRPVGAAAALRRRAPAPRRPGRRRRAIAWTA